MKRFLRWGGVGLVLFLLLLFFAPSIVGTRWVYQPVVDRLAAGDFKLSVGSLRLSWFLPLRVTDVRVLDAKGPELLRIDSITTDRGLISYLLSGKQFGKISIDKPNIQVELIEDESNLNRLIEAVRGNKIDSQASKEASPPGLPKMDVAISITGLTVSVKRVDDDRMEELVIVPATNFAASYEGLSDNPKLHIEPTLLLDQVAITPELVKIGLGYAVPLLAKSAWFKGNVSVSLSEIDIPLNQPDASNGKTKITLHQVSSGPSDPEVVQFLQFIAVVNGRLPHAELVFVDGTVIDILVENGRVFHDGLKMGLPKIDPRLQLSSKGSVGLKDKTLDIVMQVPVPIEYVTNRDDLKAVGVPSMDLPIKGTLDEPKIDLMAMRGGSAKLLGLIRSSIEESSPGAAAAIGALEGVTSGEADQVIGATLDVIREMRKKRQERKSDADTKNPDDQTPSEASENSSQSETQGRGTILDMLKKRRSK